MMHTPNEKEKPLKWARAAKERAQIREATRARARAKAKIPGARMPHGPHQLRGAQARGVQVKTKEKEEARDASYVAAWIIGQHNALMQEGAQRQCRSERCKGRLDPTYPQRTAPWERVHRHRHQPEREPKALQHRYQGRLHRGHRFRRCGLHPERELSIGSRLSTMGMVNESQQYST